MDSTLTAFFVAKVPDLVAAHPQASVTTAAILIALEHLWPLLPIKGNSTLSVLFHVIVGAAKAALNKKG